MQQIEPEACAGKPADRLFNPGSRHWQRRVAETHDKESDEHTDDEIVTGVVRRQPTRARIGKQPPTTEYLEYDEGREATNSEWSPEAPRHGAPPPPRSDAHQPYWKQDQNFGSGQQRRNAKGCNPMPPLQKHDCAEQDIVPSLVIERPKRHI